MPFHHLTVENVRNLACADLTPAPGFNLIFGPNASGKTSLLEAIHILGRAHSFRTARIAEAIRADSGLLRVVGQWRHAEGHPATTIGVERFPHGGRIHIGGREVDRQIELMRHVAIQVMRPESHLLLENGGPRLRRRLLDWGLFHVEHEFWPVWQRYHQALRQRNAALRNHPDPRSLEAWNHELVESGGALHGLRAALVEGLAARVAGLTNALLEDAFDLEYQPGFSHESGMEQALTRSISSDIRWGHTSVGPHRADFRLLWQGRPAERRVSRGQQKLLVAALLLAVSEYVAARGERPLVLLVDDLPAELDEARRAVLLDVLAGFPAQIFVTSIEPLPALRDRAGAVFQVQGGRIGKETAV